MGEREEKSVSPERTADLVQMTLYWVVAGIGTQACDLVPWIHLALKERDLVAPGVEVAVICQVVDGMAPSRKNWLERLWDRPMATGEPVSVSIWPVQPGQLLSVVQRGLEAVVILMIQQRMAQQAAGESSWKVELSGARRLPLCEGVADLVMVLVVVQPRPVLLPS
jgi:hypothetical protein